MENILHRLESWIVNASVEKVAGAIVGLFIAIALVRFFKRHLARRIADPDSRYRARKIVTFVTYFIYVVILAFIFSVRLRGLSVAVGVAGAGVALALQDVIASVAGWAAISLGEFYKIGDRVELGGVMGDVIDIGVLRTTLMECRQWVGTDLYNGRIVRVANSFVFKSPVFNYSADFPYLWDEITVPVKYGCNHRLAREIFQRVAKEVVSDTTEHAREAWNTMLSKYRIEAATTEPLVTLQANSNWIEFTIRYTVDFKKRRVVKDALFSRILEEIEKTGGLVAIASTSFAVTETPVVDVRLKRDQ